MIKYLYKGKTKRSVDPAFGSGENQIEAQRRFRTCFGTGCLDYGFRQLDPALCRWHVADAMAEKYLSISPYAYVENNPVSFTDYFGLMKRWQNPDYNEREQIIGYYNSLRGALGHYNSVGRSRGFHDYIHGTHTIEDDYVNIEGMYIWKGDVITITSLEAIRFVVDALNENNYVITFIEMPDGNIIPVASIGELGQVYLNEYGSIEGAQNKTAAYFYGSLIVESTVINWSEVASSTAGLALGVIEVVVGVVGEVPSGGIATVMIVDGAVRIGSNAYKLVNLLSGNTTVGVTSPSNLGGWHGKLLDMSMGTSYENIGYGQLIGSFGNDFVTFILTGGEWIKYL